MARAQRKQPSSEIDVATAVQMLRFFWPEFVEIHGMYFLKSFAPTPARARELLVEFGGNRTEVESMWNHRHMADIFRHKFARAGRKQDDFYNDRHPDFRAACEVARTTAKLWCHKLKAEYPTLRFRVYYTEQDNPIVRFHLVRPKEELWIREANNSDAISAGEILICDSAPRKLTKMKNKETRAVKS